MLLCKICLQEEGLNDGIINKALLMQEYKMKQRTISIFIIFICLLFIGCPNPINNSKGDYYHEYFIVSRANFDLEPRPETNSFNSYKDYKDRLKSFSIGDITSGKDYTEIRLYHFLLSIHTTTQEANSVISDINTRGNTAIWFTLKENDTDYGILYLEKL